MASSIILILPHRTTQAPREVVEAWAAILDREVTAAIAVQVAVWAETPARAAWGVTLAPAGMEAHQAAWEVTLVPEDMVVHPVAWEVIAGQAVWEETPALGDTEVIAAQAVRVAMLARTVVTAAQEVN